MGCSFLKLAFIEDVSDVVIDGGDGYLKQFRHLRLCQPHGIIAQCGGRVSGGVAR
jgi:hypothetical protein